ncbi:MAG TPA: hypothetical protein VLY86_02390 [Methanothrix sp.]|nr:hypothetical protein [Methanothrix sp.]
MRVAMILALALMLSASTACAFGGARSSSVDIVGSKVDNIKVNPAFEMPMDFEIVGSDASNITIGPPPIKVVKCFKKCRPPKPIPKCPSVKFPWEGGHLGVDAWYGTFWAYDQPNMPRWPQLKS